MHLNLEACKRLIIISICSTFLSALTPKTNGQIQEPSPGYCDTVCLTLRKTCSYHYQEEESAFKHCISSHVDCVCKNSQDENADAEGTLSLAGGDGEGVMIMLVAIALFFSGMLCYGANKKCQQHCQHCATPDSDITETLAEGRYQGGPMTSNSYCSEGTDITPSYHTAAAPVQDTQTGYDDPPMEYSPPPPYYECVGSLGCSPPYPNSSQVEFRYP